MSLNVNIAETIAPHFDDLFWDIQEHKYTHYMLPGGRGSTKSSFISEMIPLLLLQNEDCHAVIVRKNWSTLKGSVYNQVIWSLNKLGITHLFDIYKSPLKIVVKSTRQEIMFWGCDDPTKAKGITIPFGRIGVAWFEEVDQFSGMEEIRSLTQSFFRKNGNNWIFYSFNPPVSKNNWANEESQIERDDRIVVRTDYRGVPRDWLGETFIKEAEYLRDNKPDRYRHEYLGEATGTGGDVFRNLVLRKITDEEINVMDDFYYGIDFGFTIDPATWVKLYVHNNKLYVVDEIYSQWMSNEDLFRAIKKKVKDAEQYDMTADSAEPKSIAELKRLGLNVQKAKKSKDSRAFTYKFLQNLDEIVIDKNRTPNAFREFTGYEYDRNKEGQFINRYPDGNDHILDACRYAIDRLARGKVNWGW